MELKSFADDSLALAHLIRQIEAAVRIINQERHRMHIDCPLPWRSSDQKILSGQWKMQRCHIGERKVMIFRHPDLELVAAVRSLTNQQGDGENIIFAF